MKRWPPMSRHLVTVGRKNTHLTGRNLSRPSSQCVCGMDWKADTGERKLRYNNKWAVYLADKKLCVRPRWMTNDHKLDWFLSIMLSNELTVCLGLWLVNSCPLRVYVCVYPGVLVFVQHWDNEENFNFLASCTCRQSPTWLWWSFQEAMKKGRSAYS